MTKETAAPYLPLIQALLEGKLQQRNHCNPSLWIDCNYLDFDLPPASYRIKPEPREWWVWMNSGESIPTLHKQKPICDGGQLIHVREVV